MNDNINNKLYICGTPIGNMKDITIRCLDVLKQVDIIACEDTRETLKLLNFYGIKKRLISYHEHNKKTAGRDILELLSQKKNIALVSDAGMPCISDPGSDLVRLVRENLYDIEVVPGPCAFITAVALSGLDLKRFIFEGFISNKKKDQKDFINRIKFEERLVIIYEAPHRLIKTLEFLLDNLGDRKLYLARELTKIHEELFFGCISDAIDLLKKNPPRGEYVILLCGTDNNLKFDGLSIEGHLKFYLDNNCDLKTAIKNVARDRNINKNQVYSIAHGLNK